MKLLLLLPVLIVPAVGVMAQGVDTLAVPVAAGSFGLLRSYAPLLAVFIPLAAYLTSMYKDWRSAQGTLNKAFQGENDAVIYLTHKVQHNEWKRRMKRHPGFRREVLTALCLAWSVQPADYTKAMIFDGLLCIKKQGYGPETQHVLDKLLTQYRQYHSHFESEGFPQVIEDLTQLKHALATVSLPEPAGALVH